jgi:hypothetical protein
MLVQLHLNIAAVGLIYCCSHVNCRNEDGTIIFKLDFVAHQQFNMYKKFIVVDDYIIIIILSSSCSSSELLTYGAEPFLRSCKLCSYSRTSQHFMEPEGSLLCSQEPSTGPYPETD